MQDDIDPKPPRFNFLVKLLALTYALWLVLSIFTMPNQLAQIINGITLAVWLGIIVAYSPEAFRALKSKHPSPGRVLAVGILLSAFGTFILRTLLLLSRGFDLMALVNSPVLTFALVNLMVGGIIKLTVPDVIEGSLPTSKWIKIGLLSALGSTVFFVFAALADWIPKLDLNALIHW